MNVGWNVTRSTSVRKSSSTEIVEELDRRLIYPEIFPERREAEPVSLDGAAKRRGGVVEGTRGWR